MLNRLPDWLPSWTDLERDIFCGHRPEAVATALGVSASTIRRWRRVDAPKAAKLAIWWLTRWGQDAWECEMLRRKQLGWVPAESPSFDGAVYPLSIARIRAREQSPSATHIAPSLRSSTGAPPQPPEAMA